MNEKYPPSYFFGQKPASAATTTENCDYYYEKARQIIEFGSGFGGSGFGKYDGSAASTSTAYSLLYKNCVARNKR